MDHMIEQQTEDKLRYGCPEDFVQVLHKVNPSVCIEDINNDNNEVWLIKAPYNFNPAQLSGQTVVLNGTQKIANDPDSAIDYEVQAVTGNQSKCKNLNLLLPSKKTSTLVPALPIKGQMSILQSVKQPPVDIPSPAVPMYTQLPEGLKVRYTPFGCGPDRNKRLGQSIPVAGNTTEVDKTARERKKKKKKRKSEKYQLESNVPSSNVDSFSPSVEMKEIVSNKQEVMTAESGNAEIEKSIEYTNIKVKTEHGKKRRKHKETDDSDSNVSAKVVKTEDSEISHFSRKKKHKKKK
ncbi:DNA-directed RNA polymerase I subunit RPA34-like [Saccoglossus kowalevskii]|uniref:DNA-directed RNA polymerase I subunit RPA34-like n=1 Tax=Saccoglossus kowalevskii TaxID=10224 RepID=A0ABM0LV24_SACKO|nr:PREDICTED: DNA-directed RNA polymerase I subunit RPA34-like [Saccoglossus kowalevskii]